MIPAFEHRLRRRSAWEPRLHEMTYGFQGPTHPILGDDEDDGWVTVEVGYTFRPGTPDSWTEPGDAPEVEIYEIRGEDGGLIQHSDEQEEEAHRYVLENHEEEDLCDC